MTNEKTNNETRIIDPKNVTFSGNDDKVSFLEAFEENSGGPFEW